MLSGSGLCDELITRPEESCRLWCVVCDLEKTNLVNEEAKTHQGAIAPREKVNVISNIKISNFNLQYILIM